MFAMQGIGEEYISLVTDFGFTRIFGTASNKDLLINFLNSLFDGRKVIRDLKYSNSEHVGDVLYAERKAVFDVYCESEDGEKFIVEMQNASQRFFKECSVFNSTFPIREQAPKTDNWDYRQNAVYTVALLYYDMKDYDMMDDALDENAISHQAQLCNTATHRVLYDKLEFIFVEVTKFNKTEAELVTLYDKWLYALKNLAQLTERPAALRDKIFDRLFQVAEIAKFTPLELKEYEDSLKVYRDLKNSLDHAEEKGYVKGHEEGHAEGLAEGRAEGRAEGLVEGHAEGLAKGLAEGIVMTAKKLKSMGMETAVIQKATGLTAEEIEVL